VLVISYGFATRDCKSRPGVLIIVVLFWHSLGSDAGMQRVNGCCVVYPTWCNSKHCSHPGQKVAFFLTFLQSRRATMLQPVPVPSPATRWASRYFVLHLCNGCGRCVPPHQALSWHQQFFLDAGVWDSYFSVPPTWGKCLQSDTQLLLLGYKPGHDGPLGLIYQS